MYENGRKVSRYYKMREHKRRMKDRFLKNSWGNKGLSYSAYLANLTEEELNYRCGGNMMPCCLQYWTHYYDGERSKVVKQQTSRAIRDYWRQELNRCDDWEDFNAGMNGNGYQKHFDYA